MKKFNKFCINAMLLILVIIFCALVIYSVPENNEGIKFVPLHKL